ncbi:MAG: hypothetical protein ACPHL7_00130 [Flavobacteriaceae bacterium]
MKKISLLLFVLTANFSNGQVMGLFEAETPNKKNMTQIGQNWFGGVKAVLGDANGISMHHKGWGSKGVYFVQWYDDLEDMVKTMKKQEDKSAEIVQKIGEKPGDPNLLKEFNAITDPKEGSVWEYAPELSQMDNWSKLSQEAKNEMGYRRFSFVNVAMNAQGDFEAFRKAANDLDKKIGLKYHIAVFRNIFGGKDADYLTILIDKNRIEYMNNFEERMKKRRAYKGWQDERKPWNLEKFNIIKTEEVYKNMNFKLTSY